MTLGLNLVRQDLFNYPKYNTTKINFIIGIE